MVYHFITKGLDKVFEGKFECVGENAANILLFQYKLKKNLIMVKQLHINQSLLIALDLCKPHYQNLLIIYLKFITKNVDIKTVNLSVSLKVLEIKNIFISAKGVEKTVKTNKWIN